MPRPLETAFRSRFLHKPSVADGGGGLRYATLTLGLNGAMVAGVFLTQNRKNAGTFPAVSHPREWRIQMLNTPIEEAYNL